jgi:putative Holliday junction resolvase
VRAIGIDHGERRVGVAISDDTKTLARPLVVFERRSDEGIIETLNDLIREAEADGRPIDLIVVGVPRRLDGSPNERTGQVLAFVNALKSATRVEVATEDERLTSREAESRLALFHKDWRDRKRVLDAASAAVILQDYLDRMKSREPAVENLE